MIVNQLMRFRNEKINRCLIRPNPRLYLILNSTLLNLFCILQSSRIMSRILLYVHQICMKSTARFLHEKKWIWTILKIWNTWYDVKCISCPRRIVFNRNIETSKCAFHVLCTRSDLPRSLHLALLIPSIDYSFKGDRCTMFQSSTNNLDQNDSAKQNQFIYFSFWTVDLRSLSVFVLSIGECMLPTIVKNWWVHNLNISFHFITCHSKIAQSFSGFLTLNRSWFRNVSEHLSKYMQLSSSRLSLFETTIKRQHELSFELTGPSQEKVWFLVPI